MKSFLNLCTSRRKTTIRVEVNGRRKKAVHVKEENGEDQKLVYFSWEALRRSLMSLFHPSKRNKLASEAEMETETAKPPPLEAAVPVEGMVSGRGSTALLPVWQRRIMMGERCELPRFSGLILYDERGRLLKSVSGDNHNTPKAKPAEAVTTLKDLL